VRDDTPSPLDFALWAPSLYKLAQMVDAAVASDLRTRTRRGAWMWRVYPLEYLQLTQEFALAPEWVRQSVKEITQ
jgi:uncharacterized protein (DUF1810 family)